VAFELAYLGWSGFRICWTGGPAVFVDPPDADALPRDGEAWIVLSHGHPEHVEGTKAYLADPGREAPATVVASEPVCRHLRRRSVRSDDVFHPVGAGDTLSLPGLTLAAFAWRHMPLVPPEPKLAAQHIARLATHPGTTYGIVRDGLIGPPPGAKLGFRMLPDEGPRVLLYSEGLHRRTREAEIREIGASGDVEVLIFAVEPEDADALPDLVAALGASIAVPYEAHREWREELGMPQADLERLTRDLASRGITTLALTGGERILLSQGDWAG
jgi:hypothetical protein